MRAVAKICVWKPGGKLVDELLTSMKPIAGVVNGDLSRRGLRDAVVDGRRGDRDGGRARRHAGDFARLRRRVATAGCSTTKRDVAVDHGLIIRVLRRRGELRRAAPARTVDGPAIAT